jgi:hypothetical protein
MSKQNITDSQSSVQDPAGPQDSVNRSSDLLKLIFYWSVASIPLIWGVAMTLLKALALFRA